jgi:hypothetical protein
MNFQRHLKLQFKSHSRHPDTCPRHRFLHTQIWRSAEVLVSAYENMTAKLPPRWSILNKSQKYLSGTISPLQRLAMKY